MAADYSQPILEGPGKTDYARYMRTDELLSLQRHPDEMGHHDELLFQTVHQSTELWLKHACFEVHRSVHEIEHRRVEQAIAYLSRAITGVRLITGQLEMLTHMTPSDFQEVRVQLGNGSGFESPGWNGISRVSGQLGSAFEALCTEHDIDLLTLYREGGHTPTYRLAEALIEWDERIALWRIRHFRIAIRTIGIQAVGTKGTPVDQLFRLITRKFYPALWQVRSDLTLTGPLGGLEPALHEEITTCPI